MIQQFHSFLGTHPKDLKTLLRHLSTHVPSSTSCTSQDVSTACGWGGTRGHKYGTALFSLKEEENSDAFYSMEET